MRLDASVYTWICTRAFDGTGVEILHRTPSPRYQHHPRGIPSGAISGLVAESREPASFLIISFKISDLNWKVASLIIFRRERERDVEVLYTSKHPPPATPCTALSPSLSLSISLRDIDVVLARSLRSSPVPILIYGTLNYPSRGGILATMLSLARGPLPTARSAITRFSFLLHEGSMDHKADRES